LPIWMAAFVNFYPAASYFGDEDGVVYSNPEKNAEAPSPFTEPKPLDGVEIFRRLSSGGLDCFRVSPTHLDIFKKFLD
jgi:hypothetical protein